MGLRGNSSIFKALSEQAKNWSGTILGWGLTVGVAASFFVERLPMFRRDIFCNIPILGNRYSSYRPESEEEDS